MDSILPTPWAGYTAISPTLNTRASLSSIMEHPVPFSTRKHSSTDEEMKIRGHYTTDHRIIKSNLKKHDITTY
jgi:hypothetical protein